MDTVRVIERPGQRADRLDEQLMLAIQEHLCPRCHYDLDHDGYCSMCGHTLHRPAAK